MSIKIIEIIGEDRVKFKNSAIPSQNLGDISWTELESLGGDLYETTVTGTNVEGNAIEETTTQITVPTVNPTKVFFAIVAIIQEIVCPECIN